MFSYHFPRINEHCKKFPAAEFFYQTRVFQSLIKFLGNHFLRMQNLSIYKITFYLKTTSLLIFFKKSNWQKTLILAKCIRKWTCFSKCTFLDNILGLHNQRVNGSVEKHVSKFFFSFEKHDVGRKRFWLPKLSEKGFYGILYKTTYSWRFSRTFSLSKITSFPFQELVKNLRNATKAIVVNVCFSRKPFFSAWTRSVFQALKNSAATKESRFCTKFVKMSILWGVYTRSPLATLAAPTFFFYAYLGIFNNLFLQQWKLHL